MSHAAKLSIAVVLALVAAGLNAMWLSSEKRPPVFVAAAVELPAGQEITDAVLMAVPVPGDFDQLRASLIPYANRAILLGMRTLAHLHPRRRVFSARHQSTARAGAIRSARPIPVDQRRRPLQTNGIWPRGKQYRRHAATT